MGAFLLAACVLTYYYHAKLGVGVIFTHLFYIPIILASIWWRKRGVLVALFLGILIIMSHALFLKGMPLTDDIVRAVMFVLTGFVVARLMEGLKKVEDLFRTLST
jgi:pilus assembly protein TadC